MVYVIVVAIGTGRLVWNCVPSLAERCGQRRYEWVGCHRLYHV